MSCLIFLLGSFVLSFMFFFGVFPFFSFSVSYFLWFDLEIGV